MFVPADAPVKISVLRLQEPQRPRAPRLRDELQRTRPRRHARGERPLRHHRIRPQRAAPSSRATPTTTSSPRASPSPRRARRSFTLTCDRKEFVGRNGTLERPAALRRAELSGRAGAGLDPCAAMQTVLELAPGETREVVFLLGEGETEEEARAVVTRYRQLQTVYEAFEKVLARWDEILGAGRGEDARRGARHDLEPLAALPDARLPRLGALGLLSIGRGLRLPRPVAGRDGARLLRAVNRARADRARRRAPVPRGRRAALVAPAHRAGRPHALLGRPAVAALRHELLRREDGRPRPCSTRPRPSSKRRRSPRARTRPTRSPSSRRSGRASTSTARARSTAASPPARTACR